MSIVKKFSKYLTAIEYPKKNNMEHSWYFKGKNAFYRFDVRDV